MASKLSRLFSGLKIAPMLSSVRQRPTIRSSSSYTIQPLLYHYSFQSRRSTSTLPIRCHLTQQLSFQSLNSVGNRLLLRPVVPEVKLCRTKTLFGIRKGKAKTVKPVVKRFYRLDWGIWIRPRVGRARKYWRKSKGRKFRLKQHVFCNGQQSKLLDHMVTPFWTRKKYYVDDPYEPYQKRTNFALFPEKPKPFYP